MKQRAPGRPPLSAANRTFNVTVPDTLAERVYALIKERDWTLAAFVRRAIAEKLEREESVVRGDTRKQDEQVNP